MSVIMDLDGQPFKRPSVDGKTTEDMTVKYALRFALTTPEREQQGQPASTEDKFELYELARKVYFAPHDKNLELTAPEVTKILEKCKKIWTVEIYGYLYELLEKNPWGPFPEEAPLPMTVAD